MEIAGYLLHGSYFASKVYAIYKSGATLHSKAHAVYCIEATLRAKALLLTHRCLKRLPFIELEPNPLFEVTFVEM